MFTCNTKHHPGAKVWVAGNTFLVNGRRHPYLRNSRYEAERAARLLAAAGAPVAVAGVVVVVGAALLTADGFRVGQAGSAGRVRFCG